MHGGRELADGYRKYKRVDLLIMSENNDINEKSFGKKLKELWNYLKKYKNNFQFIFICLFIGFVFEKLLVKIYDDTIMRLLSEVNEGWFFACIMFAALTGFAWYLWKKKCETSLDAVPRMILIITLALIYVRYRFTGAYIYYPEGCWIKYLDILFLILSAYAVYQIRLNYKAEPDSGDSPVPHDDSNFISGYPIEDKADDELGFGNSAQNIADRLDKVPSGVSFSIGINSAWGDGKTSYMNLICKHIEDSKKYILVNFNPAESKVEDLIQVDFFEKIKSALREDNGELSSLIDNYMKAIGIVDESNLVSKMRELKETFCHSSELDKLKAALVKINKRLIIIIDDIDRLTPEEALKTIKLVRYTTANISDIIFITIYDRDCINQLAKNKKGDDLSLFWDKFFDMEIQLPYRPPSFLISYMKKQLGKWFDEFEPTSFEKVMNDLGNDFILFIRNLRDAKRFLNAFYMEYLDVKGEVKIEHLLHVKLLKYRYIDVFYALRAKKFIEVDPTSGIEYYPNGIYRLKNGYEAVLKNIEKDPESVDVIKKILIFLFPNSVGEKLVRPINDVDSFETYFQDKISNTLSLKDIISLFTLSEQDAMSIIDEWNGRGCIDELIYYLKLRDYLEIEDKETFEFCVKLSFNLLQYTQNYHYYRHLTGYFNKNDVTIFSNKYYEGDSVQYIKYFEDLFERDSREQHTYHRFIRQILINLFGTADDAKETWIFDREYFIKCACDGCIYYFKNQISKENKYNLAMGLELLKSCVQDVSNNIPVLDQVACQLVKKYIIEHPVEYFSLFIVVYTLPYSGKTHIFPDISYVSIFESINDFETFLYGKELDELKEIILVRNFWELYKSNGNAPIECKDEISIQKKMDADFSNEVKQLRRAREIQKEVSVLSREIEQEESLDSQKQFETFRKLEDYRIEFNNIELKTKEIQNAERSLGEVNIIRKAEVVSETDA